ATFVDPGGSEPLQDYTAKIDWGDQSGTDATGTIVDHGNGNFSVTGTHIYKDEGSYTFKVTITHDQLSPVLTSATATVADAALMATAANVSAYQGIPVLPSPLVTFTDANPFGTVSDFTATVAWGDGTSSTGTVSASGAGFAVSGSHAYGVPGSYSVVVTIK